MIFICTLFVTLIVCQYSLGEEDDWKGQYRHAQVPFVTCGQLYSHEHPQMRNLSVPISCFTYLVTIVLDPHNDEGIYTGSKKCLGAIYNPSWIITSADCTIEFTTNSIEDINIRVFSGILGYVVDHFIIHPDFHLTSHENNIILLHIKNRVHYANFVNPALLVPGEREPLSELYHTCQMIFLMEQSRLQFVDVTLVPIAQCQRSIDFAVLDPMGHICSTKVKSSSGAFLLCGDEIHKIYGILNSDGLNTKHLLFTYISYYNSWIKKTVRDHDRTYNRKRSCSNFLVPTLTYLIVLQIAVSKL